MAKKKNKGRFMKGTLISIFLFLIIYVIANLFVFYHTSTEPSTLTTCVFAFCGLEGGLLGWIKTSKLGANTVSTRQSKREEEDNR